MERLTNDHPRSNLGIALNLFYAKDGEAWVRGGGPAPAYQDITLNGWILKIIKEFSISPQLFDGVDDETIAEIMAEWLYDGSSTNEGLIATLYTAGWAFAELRARLKAYEDTGITPEQVAAMDVTDINCRDNWIPVAERMPPERNSIVPGLGTVSKPVLVTWMDPTSDKAYPDNCFVKEGITRNGEFTLSHINGDLIPVAWMPQPVPYELPKEV